MRAHLAGGLVGHGGGIAPALQHGKRVQGSMGALLLGAAGATRRGEGYLQVEHRWLTCCLLPLVLLAATRLRPRKELVLLAMLPAPRLRCTGCKGGAGASKSG